MSHRSSHPAAAGRCKYFAIASSFSLLALLAGSTSRSTADVLILKDGYAIHGKLNDEKTVIFDAITGQEIVVKKAAGFTTVDDGARYTIFSSHYKTVGDVNNFNKFQDDIRLTHFMVQETAYALPNVLSYRSETDFSPDWRRTLTFDSDQRVPFRIKQQLTVLTPHYLVLDSTTHKWRCYYLTRELGYEKVRKLLSTHPELIEKTGVPDIDKRSKIIRFLIQADWLTQAEGEIEILAKDLPNETKKVEDLKKEIRDIRQERQVADLERAKESGRHGYALATLKQLPTKEQLPRNLGEKVLAIKVEYEASVQKFNDAKRYMEELKGKMKGANAPLGAALGEILKEVHLDTIQRLDSFITLAAQSERDLKLEKKPFYGPEQIVAAAISGWLQGPNAAAPKVDDALKLLVARDMALEYLRCDNPAKRAALLADYEKNTLALSYDQLEKLVSLLPPPMAQSNLPDRAVAQQTEIISETSSPVKFTLLLPPEYQHSRPYPLLLVLPDSGQKAQDILNRIGDLAAKYGYVVAIMNWGDEDYENSPEGVAMVTGLLRHMRRSFQIDSDRVFLMGYGKGASMTMDVAAGHPDLFAGVVPLGPVPSHKYLILGKYWTNFQYLPIYLVMGDRAGDSIRTVRAVYTDWMRLGFPALCISYKGRGNDQFNEELPYAFDWMSRKTRATAIPAVGSDAQPFHTMRPYDNRFYWLSTQEISKAHQGKDALRNAPAHINGRILEGNVISVWPAGVNQLTIWIGKGMIDFTKPVTVTMSQTQRELFKKKLTPNVSVLMEDLYERGDRQRPALQRIDLSNLTKGFPKATSP